MISKNNLIPTIVLILSIILIGGTFVLAERSIPGSSLYSLKTKVSEPVAGIFAFGEEEKIEWKERLMERRLEEVKKLVLLNKLNETLGTELDNKIKTEIMEINRDLSGSQTEKERFTGAENLNIRLQACLSAYQSVLENLSSDPNINADTKKENDAILSTIKQSLHTLQGNDETEQPETEENALDVLNSTKISYQREKINLMPSIQDKIDNDFALAEQYFRDGKNSIEASDDKTAGEKFHLVISKVNEIKLLILSNVIENRIEHKGHDDRDDEDEREED